MKTKIRTLDINAHIENLTINVISENNYSVAVIAFDNMGYGDITDIKFTAKGYNKFNDAILIDNSNSFNIIIQNILVKRNEHKDIKVILPDHAIQKVTIEENQICFSDNSIVTYLGLNEKNIEVDELDENADNDVLSLLHKMYDDEIKYYVKNLDDNDWICSCGRYNKGNSICTLCKKKKSDTEFAMSPEGLKKLNKQYIENIVEEEKQKKIKKNKKKYFIIILLFLLFSLGSVIFYNIYTDRLRYNSEDDMKNDLQGTYISEEDDDYKVEIVGDIFRYIENDKYISNCLIKWYPEEGTIYADQEIIVKSSGNLKIDNVIYVKSD